MKIMSWNVNQFLEQHNWKALQGEHSAKAELWKKIVPQVLSLIIEHIATKEDLVILYEVPFVKEQEYVDRKGRIRYKRSKEEYDVNKWLKKYCEENGLQVWIPEQEEVSFFRTIAISKNDAYRPLTAFPSKSFEPYAYRIIALEKLGDDFERAVIGIHAPDDIEFLKKVEKYVEKHKSKNLIILGDFNIATNEWRAKKHKEQMEKGEKVAECKDFFERRKWLLETMPSIGYSDIVDREKPTYFWQEKGQLKETTVDHVLVSLTLKDKVTIDVKRHGKYELSDHAVIIVDIEE